MLFHDFQKGGHLELFFNLHIYQFINSYRIKRIHVCRYNNKEPLFDDIHFIYIYIFFLNVGLINTMDRNSSFNIPGN